MGVRDVAVLVGSLRRESLNRKMALALGKLAPPSLRLRLVELGDLPLYNPDIEGQVGAWTAFRDSVAPAHAVLFVTPEYNRSMPAAMKNALDVGSRPTGKGALNGKPCAIVSVSPGMIGGFGANHHLRQSLVFLNMAALPQPEAYVGGADKLFDPDGALLNASTREFLGTFMTAFAAWIERFVER